jgi:hypothetical protein
MKSLHVGGGYRHDPQSMRKVKDNILELRSSRCQVPGSLSLSLSPLSTSAELSGHMNIYYTMIGFGVAMSLVRSQSS